MLNTLRDGQINYGTTNCPSAHVPPHNVVAPIHQNSLHSTEPSTPVATYPWNSNPRLEHLYGFHSRYYNLDFPSPYPPATNQYVPPNIYGQNVSQCCQPCCRLRSQNIPKTSPPQVLYNQIRPVQQLNRSYKSKKTLKTPCSEQFLPYIPNDLPVKYDTQNCYQQKYGSSYFNNTNYCPPANNLWIPPTTNPTWPADRLRPVGRHSGVTSHDFSREKSYQRLQHYQTNPYSSPTSSTHHRPYNYLPPIPDVQSYQPSVYHNPLKNNTSEYLTQEHNFRLPISSQNNQSPTSLPQYYNAQPVPYSDVQKPSESFKSSQVTPQNSSKSNLNVREFLATWDEGEEETNEKSSETTAPIVVLDCMTLEGDALTKIQEKLNVVSYENLEKVLKENNNPLVINTESNEIDPVHNKVKPPSKPNFEPIDYTKRETGIIKPFNTEKKRLPTTNTQTDKNYSVNFDGMVAWYGKKNADISSTDLIERLADRIFNLSKSQENDGVSFGTAAYTGQITQTNRSFASTVKDSAKYLPSQHMYGLQHHTDKCIEPSVINKIDCNNDPISRIHSCVLNESKKESTIKTNNINSSCIVENITKKCLNVTNEETPPWTLDQETQEQHLNMSLYDHSVIIKPLDFSSFTNETKSNPFMFEKNPSIVNKSNNSINDQFNKVLNENNNYNSTDSNNQQMDSTNRNFPVIVSPHVHRQEYSGLHESVIQRTGCDKNKHDKVSAQTDFESINWNLSNDIDKMMKTSNISMEPPCLYDRNNYTILDNINSDKIVSTQWKDHVPCVDLTVNNKTNNNHDSFFDSWNFIENYETHSSKKLINPHSNNNEVHNPLFSNQITSLDESNNKLNPGEKIENDSLIPLKDIPNAVPSINERSRDVFNLNNRIPDFSDGFELPTIHEPHDYMQFKKVSNDGERRTDGSIFEHLNETKCNRTINEITNIKNDQNKSDIISLPSFKEKEPLAPMLVPPKLNIVKPILRDPSQIYTVIKQKHKNDNNCIDNDNVASHKTINNLRENHSNNFDLDLKSKYNSVQLNQFDVWSEKFELKNNSNNSSNAVVHCDVEITQFKSIPENRNTLIPKTSLNEDKNEKLSENTNCNLTMNKINAIENEKINSNDFLTCLESTKTDDQKYRDTLDEFETSFGFDIHCNHESSKCFHEDIVDKCLEERLKDQIGEHNVNASNLNNTPNTNITSSSTQLPFQCDFQSGYLIKNYFDENKTKSIVFDRKQSNNNEKSNKTSFNYHGEMKEKSELQNNNNLQIAQINEKNTDYKLLNNMNCGTGQIQNDDKKNNSNFNNQVEFKPFEPNHCNSNINELSNTEKNNLNYLSIEDQHFKFESNKRNILDLTLSKEIIEINKLASNDDICKISCNDSDIHESSNISKDSSVNFELNINDSNIFETNSNTPSIENKTETIKNLELQSVKNTFDSTFHSDNPVNIKQHNFNTKNVFGIDNNNCAMYQSQNLEKMNEFDFETRIIQNFEMECSSSNVEESANSKKVFTCENEMKTTNNLEINDENNKQKVTFFNSVSNTHVAHPIEKTSSVDGHDITQLNNVIETEIANQKNKIDHTFEVDCNIDIEQEKKTKVYKDFDIQNKNMEEMNLINSCTHENSSANNQSEVDNIFENLYDNLTTLNTNKENSNISDSCCQNYDKIEVSEIQEYVKDQKLKTNNSVVIVDEDCRKIKIDKCHNKVDETFEDSNTVLLQELVNNSTSQLMPALLQQNTILEDTTSKECASSQLNKHAQNKNVNVLDISKVSSSQEHTLEKLQNDDFQQNKIGSLKQNIVNAIKNVAVDTVHSDTMNKMFENIKSDLSDPVENTDITINDEHSPDISYGSCSLNLVELSNQQFSKQIIEVENSTNSEMSFLDHVKLTCQQSSTNNIEVEVPASSEPNLLNLTELACKQNSNNDAEVQDSVSSKFHFQNSSSIKNRNLADSESSSLMNDESIHQHFNKVVEVKEPVTFESNGSNSADFACQGNSNNTVEDKDLPCSMSSSSNQNIYCVEVENSASSESNLSNNSEKVYQYKYNFESLNTACSRTNLSYQNELTCLQISNNVNVENSSSFELNAETHTEQVSHQNPCNDDEVEAITCSETNVSNHMEHVCQQNAHNNVEVEDLASSKFDLLNHAKQTCEQNFNNKVEVEDLHCTGFNLSNRAEHVCPQNSNTVKYLNHSKVEDSICSESNLSNHAEQTCQQISNNIAEVDDAARTGYNMSNLTEQGCQQNSQKNIEVENLANFAFDLSKHAEHTCQKNSNHIVEVEDSKCSESNMLNHAKNTCHQISNYTVAVKHLASSKYDSSNHIESTHQQNSNNNIEFEDSTCSKTELSNFTEHASQQNSKTTVDVECLVNPKSSSLSHTELVSPQNSNIVLAEDSASSDSSSHVEFTYQKNADNFDKIENSTCPESTSPLNHIKLTVQKHDSDIAKVEDKTDYKSSLLRKTKSKYRQHPYKQIEFKESTGSKPISLNIVKCQSSMYTQHSSEIADAENLIDSRLDLLNNEISTCQQHSNNIVEVENVDNTIKNTTLFDNNMKLPRVKFTFKCHRKNVVKTNIFENESVVPLKKYDLLRDEKLITQNIFKKNRKFYKPWHDLYEKKSDEDPKEIIKEVIETICSQIINVDIIPQSTETFNFNDKKKEYEVISTVEFPSSIEVSDNTENEETYINTCDSIVVDSPTLNKLYTPMPSPFDDFQSKNPTPEHYGCEEYWDKSLENEYNNVLNKTISKLTKIRVNIRDKFDIRILARKINETKLKKWRRWCKQRRRLEKTRSNSDNVGDFEISDITAVKDPTEMLRLNVMTKKITTDPICKIKVQLPWGRIFNFNNSGVENDQKIKDTKLELGPAKVEVRLSQIPGEWQVATCESMKSSKSVVSVRRLVLQRAGPAKEDYGESRDSLASNCVVGFISPPNNFGGDCSSPVEDFNDDCENSKNSNHGGFNIPVKDNCSGRNSPEKDNSSGCNSHENNDDSGCNSHKNNEDSGCNSLEKDNIGDCYNCPTEDYDGSCTTISSSSKDNCSSSCATASSSKDESDLREHSRILPKIVIRRIGQDNNYTSYVSRSGSEGGDKNGGTRQLIVRLVRDRKLDEMAAEGITTVHLNNNTPISKSAGDTHGAKRVRYT